jgi:hypothetical protein
MVQLDAKIQSMHVTIFAPMFLITQKTRISNINQQLAGHQRERGGAAEIKLH